MNIVEALRGCSAGRARGDRPRHGLHASRRLRSARASSASHCDRSRRTGLYRCPARGERRRGAGSRPRAWRRSRAGARPGAPRDAPRRASRTTRCCTRSCRCCRCAVVARGGASRSIAPTSASASDATPNGRGRAGALGACGVGRARRARPQPLVKALRERYPDHRLLLTHMTATGRATGARLVRRPRSSLLPALRLSVGGAPVSRPLPPAPRRADGNRDLVQPRARCAARGIPMMLANARLSERSARGYAKAGALTRDALAALEDRRAERRRCDAADAPGRARGDGHRQPQVRHRRRRTRCSNVRPRLRARYGDRPVLLAGSTREGEEALMLDALAARPLRGCCMVIVPRHPQRFDEVAAMLARRGLPFSPAQREPRGARRLPLRAGRQHGRDVRVLRGVRRRVDRRQPAAVRRAEPDRGRRRSARRCSIGPSSFNFAEASDAGGGRGRGRAGGRRDGRREGSAGAAHRPGARAANGGGGRRFAQAPSRRDGAHAGADPY